MKMTDAVHASQISYFQTRSCPTSAFHLVTSKNCTGKSAPSVLLLYCVGSGGNGGGGGGGGGGGTVGAASSTYLGGFGEVFSIPDPQSVNGGVSF